MTFGMIICAMAFAMGVAIQNGTVCAVLAVEELMQRRRPNRFIGFLECGLWAAIVIWSLGGTPAASPLAGLLILGVGAALYGAGAAINGACAFGAIARLGNGRLDYLMTGITAVVALKAVSIFVDGPTKADLDVAGGIATLVPIISALAALMLLRWWTQHTAPFRVFLKVGVAMALIGGLGAAIGYLHQPWPWTSTLSAVPDIQLLSYFALAALILGAIAGGLWDGRFMLTRPTLRHLRDRAIGGALMGSGIALVPGGNDALILRGIPNGSLSALYGYGIMLLAIALVLKLRGGIFPPWRKSADRDPTALQS